jgi:hypothetical protein
MSEFDPIKSLRDAGLLPEAPESHGEEGHKGGIALEVLSTLNEQEVEVLKSVRERMNAAMEEAEVGAHSNVTGAGLW